MFRKRVLWFLTFLCLAGLLGTPWLQAQEKRRQPRGRLDAPRQIDRPLSPAVRRSAPDTRQSRPAPRPRHGGPTGSFSAPDRSRPGSSQGDLRRLRGNPLYADPRLLRQCSRFYQRLWWQYGFLPHTDVLYRYSLGDSAITPPAARQALGESNRNASELLLLSQQLKELLEAFERGEIEEDRLQVEAEEKLKGIRKLAKKVRKDFYVHFLDQRQDQSFSLPPKGNSPQELRALIEKLSELSRRLHDDIQLLRQEEATQVVDFQWLKRGSVKSTAQALDKLAKNIEKTLDRL